jgi:hypothetical protein
MRKSVQPSSRSLPHITVRYSRAEAYLPTDHFYDEFVADEVTLSEPATFDHQGSQAEKVGTVFFRCLSDQLEFLHYKPDFPQSVFHVSVYDGAPNEVAARALKVFREFPWDLRVALPKTRLVARSHKLPSDGSLTPAANALLGTLGFDLYDLASAESQPSVWRSLCSYLHANLPRIVYPRSGTVESYSIEEPHPEQGAFWSRIELMDDLTRHRMMASERNHLRKRGAFMTPPEVAYDIVKGASKLIGARDVAYGDPSSGGGIFLAALLRQIGPQRIKSATLVDSDRSSAAMAADRWAHLGSVAAVDDFVSRMIESLSSDERDVPAHHWTTKRPDLIITNPPYVRSQSIDDERAQLWRRTLDQRFGMRLTARNDLYAYFVLAAHEWLRDEGVAVWLLPNEFMFTNYGKGLRDYLTQDVTLLKVHTYDGPSVFANARVSSCAVFYVKRPATEASIVEFSAGGSIDTPIVTRGVPIKALASASKWHTVADEGVVLSPQSNYSKGGLARIGDFFRVRRGIATGANALFVVSDSHAKSFGAGASQWLKPVLPRARELVGPVVETDEAGTPLLPKVRWLIDSDAELSEIERESPALAEYLRQISLEASGRTLVARRNPFYRQEKNRPARIFFSYMSRDVAPARRFYLNRSNAVALNNYLVLEPRPWLADWMDGGTDRDFAVLTALRELDASDMARGGRVYVEGLTKMEPRELAALPFALDRSGETSWPQTRQ